MKRRTFALRHPAFTVAWMLCCTVLLGALLAPRLPAQEESDPRKEWRKHHLAAQQAAREGRYVEAENRIRQAVLIARKADLVAPYVNSLVSLGDILLAQGQFREAEKAYRGTLKLAMERFPAAHIPNAFLRTKLARTLLALSRSKEAEPLLLQALNVFRSQGKKGDRNTADVLLLLGRAYSNMDHGQEALQMLQAALKLKIGLEGAGAPAVAMVRMNLALTLKTLDRLREAGAEIEQALQVLEQADGMADEFADALRIKADIARQRQNLAEAVTLYLRALALMEKRLEPTDLSLVPLLTNLGVAYLEKKEPEKARGYFHRALLISAGTLGNAHPDVAMAENNLAYVLIELKQLDEAEKHLSSARQTLEARQQENTSGYISILDSIAVLHREKKEYKAAEKLHKLAIARGEKLYGPGHSRMTALLANYAELLRRLGRGKEAEQLEARVKAIRGTIRKK